MENIKLIVQMTAADQLAEPDKNAAVVENGLLLPLLLLEKLFYPTTEFKIFFGE